LFTFSSNIFAIIEWTLHSHFSSMLLFHLSYLYMIEFFLA
jgi:hypothetical protein